MAALPEGENTSARVDQPHPVRPATAKAPTHEPASVGTGESDAPLPIESGDPVAQQAASLAERLADQQQELDRRAEQLSAREADIESKLHSARVWFDEQHEAFERRSAELADREAALGSAAHDADEQAAAAALSEEEDARLAEREREIDTRQAELDARQADLYEQIDRLTADRTKFAEREAALDARQAEIERLEKVSAETDGQLTNAARDQDQRQAELDVREAELRKLQAEVETDQAEVAACETHLAARQAEVEAAIKRFEGLGVTEQRIAELTEQTQQFAARARYLDDAEAMLADEKQAVADERLELDRQRQAAQEEFVVERRRIETERSEVRTRVKQFEQQAETRQAQLDQRQAALEQLQAELQAGQREVLEMRLATEETWAQLAGALAPATLTRSIAQVRSRLADHYRHTLEEIAERRRELQEISGRLAGEHTRLDEQRAQLQLWAGRREEDIEQRAARLIGREQELDRQQRYYEQLELQWAAERDGYRDKIQRLLAETRVAPTARAA